MQLIVYCSLAAVVFLVSALLPLGLRTDGEVDVPGMTVGERAAVFSAYWDEPDGSRVSMKNEGKLEPEVQKACEERMSVIMDSCRIDQQTGAAKKEGSEYFTLVSKAGDVNICRKWVEWQGDWRNWMDVCFDADSGELYYLYVSAECLSNYKSYTGALPAEFGAAYIAECLGKEMGYELLYLDVPEDNPNSMIASYHCGSSALRLRINCNYHESVLLDVLIKCEM